MLPSRIHVPPPSNPDPEDIFSSSLSTIFPDSNINSHGDPGGSLIYASPTYGDIHLRVPAHPDKEEGRQLFAHYLWNAAGVVADEIERAATSVGRANGKKEQDGRHWWDMRGERVLELGAGTALPSIIAAHASAKDIYITDHPLSPALTTGSIQENVKRNLRVVSTQEGVLDTNTKDGAPTELVSFSPTLYTESKAQNTQVTILPHIWGTGLSSPSSSAPSLAPSLAHTFTKILIADCLWMPSQHTNLVRTIKHFLQPLPTSRHASATSPTSSAEQKTVSSQPCALVVAGFHTGRSIVAGFFRTATAPPPPPPPTNQENGEAKEEGEVKGGGKLAIEEIYELDVNDGSKREFLEERPREGREEARRWCVVAVLTLRGGEEREGSGIGRGAG
ncbi:MAG: hypothetical protein Q9160_006403 [Pyrenula sp. 1 TL-2023]